jgi:NAD(P)H-dependent FMN reductase
VKSILIVFHSRTGGAEQMAHAANASAQAETAVRTLLKRAADAQAQDLLDADGYIFAAPENLAALSGAMKEFFDRTYYPVLDRIQGRPYAVLVCAGSDGRNAVRQIERICTGWRLKAVAEPVIVCTHAQTPEAILRPKTIGPADLARCAEIGGALAAGVALGIF